MRDKASDPAATVDKQMWQISSGSKTHMHTQISSLELKSGCTVTCNAYSVLGRGKYFSLDGIY